MTQPNPTKKSISLSQDNLPALAARVSVPAYDRSALTPGIVHIGVGNFHRAHQAVYLDWLFAMGEDHDWALVGAGVRAHDAALRADLEAQDWLTTIVELDPEGLTARICGSMIDYAEVEPQAVIEALVAPAIRIVSLTVTEGGYFVDAATGGFQSDHPDIRHDIDYPGRPKTVFGILCEALRRRRAADLPPFTVMSCDNLPENGAVTAQATIGLARAADPELADWIEQHVAFPNGMVDCITPATSDRERDMVKHRFGVDDKRPVVCEPFRQWVLEDHFSAGRPALEKVGVEFVDDVAPYELMKLRILNGGHAAIAYPSALLGHHYVHEAMADPDIRAWLARLERTEIMPSVPEIPGIDFDAYFEKVAERFSNPEVGDTVARLCLDGSNRQPKFILPVIRERIAAGKPIAGLALEVALWCRFCAGPDESGRAIEIDDDRADILARQAIAARDRPAAFLEIDDVFGDLAGQAAFVEPFGEALENLWRTGIRDTLQHYLSH